MQPLFVEHVVNVRMGVFLFLLDSLSFKISPISMGDLTPMQKYKFEVTNAE